MAYYDELAAAMTADEQKLYSTSLDHALCALRVAHYATSSISHARLTAGEFFPVVPAEAQAKFAALQSAVVAWSAALCARIMPMSRDDAWATLQTAGFYDGCP